MKTGNKRSAMGFTVRDVAEAAGVGYRTCLTHEKDGLWVYGDLMSVVNYINDRRDRLSGGGEFA